MPERKLRVLVAKPGLDGHDRGAKVIARALRDAGMEDVDLIGLSILSGAHMALAPRILELLRENDLADVRVIIGGIIPEEDVAALKAMGIAGVYGPGSSTADIIADIHRMVGAAAE